MKWCSNGVRKDNDLSPLTGRVNEWGAHHYTSSYLICMKRKYEYMTIRYGQYGRLYVLINKMGVLHMHERMLCKRIRQSVGLMESPMDQSGPLLMASPDCYSQVLYLSNLTCNSFNKHFIKYIVYILSEYLHCLNNYCPLFYFK